MPETPYDCPVLDSSRHDVCSFSLEYLETLAGATQARGEGGGVDFTYDSQIPPLVTFGTEQ